jgi:hypothetical protein
MTSAERVLLRAEAEAVTVLCRYKFQFRKTNGTRMTRIRRIYTELIRKTNGTQMTRI